MTPNQDLLVSASLCLVALLLYLTNRPKKSMKLPPGAYYLNCAICGHIFYLNAQDVRRNICRKHPEELLKSLAKSQSQY